MKAVAMELDVKANEVSGPDSELGSPRIGSAALQLLRVIGAGLLVASGAIHLDLYSTGYRTIPGIGDLFLAQVVAAIGLGAVVLFTGSRVAAAAGAGVAIMTVSGYLLSLRVSLLGFREVRTTAGAVAGLVEVAAFLTLGGFAFTPRSAAGSRKPASVQWSTRSLPELPLRSMRVAVATIAVAAALLLVVSVATAPGPTTTAASAHPVLGFTVIRGPRCSVTPRG